MKFDTKIVLTLVVYIPCLIVEGGGREKYKIMQNIYNNIQGDPEKLYFSGL